MNMNVLMLAVVLLFTEPGSGLKRASSGPCFHVCSEEDCITVNWDRVDFQSAEKSCRDKHGELLTLPSETHQQTFDVLSKKLSGSFWIGLRLPAGSCSDPSAPLRGYRWTSGKGNHSASSIIWTERSKLCSPRCVSLLDHQEWEESLCSDKADGFLCRTQQQQACQEKEKTFKNPNGCKDGPCEHQCSSVNGGYKCSCFKGYKPDRNYPRRCRLFCGQKTCPAVCDSPDQCSCPDGFILSGQTCEDINECEMGQCSDGCLNSFGSFMCFCHEGFVLKDHVDCVPAAEAEAFDVITTPVAEFVKPATKNVTLRSAANPGGVFLWIWVLVALTLVVSVFLIRFQVVKRQKRREQTQQSAAPGGNVEF